MPSHGDDLSTLPFDAVKQAAFFGHLFHESNGLFKQFRYVADETWFANPLLANAWKVLIQYLETVRHMPTSLELANWTYTQVVLGSKEAAKACSKAILAASESTSRISVEHLRNELELWMQARLFQSAIAKTTQCFNTSKFPMAAQVFRETINKFNQIQSYRFEDKRFDATDEIVESFQSQGYVKFGLPGVDQHLNPDGAGGLALGDQTLILAPQNVGKTTTLLTVVMHNVLDGEYALFQSHEGRDTDLRMKGMRCALTLATLPQLGAIFGVAPDNETLAAVQETFREQAATLRGTLDLMSRPKDDQVRKYYEHFATWISDHLYYRPVNNPGMAVEDVVPVIERAQDDCVHARGGKGFSMLASDYPGLLGCKRAGKEYAYRQVLDLVYREYVQMAIKYKWHSLCAIQGNREAGKINSGQNRGYANANSQRFLTTEDIAEAYGPGQSATNVITLNRSPNDEAQNQITFYITKSRSSRTKLAVTAYDRMAQGATHSNEFGWLSYYHSSGNQMLLQRYMQRGRGATLTQEQVITALRDSDEQ